MLSIKKKFKKKIKKSMSKKKIKRISMSKKKTRSKKYLDGGFIEEKLKVVNILKTISNKPQLIIKLINVLETVKDFTPEQRIEIFNMMKDIINRPEFNEYIKGIIDKQFNEILKNIITYFNGNLGHRETIINLFDHIENDKDYTPEQKIQIFSELNKTISTNPSLKGLDEFKKIILQKIYKQKGLLELKTKEHIELLKYRGLIEYTDEIQNALHANNIKLVEIMINSILSSSRIDIESKKPYMLTAFNCLLVSCASIYTPYESLPIIEKCIYTILNSKILSIDDIKFHMNTIRNLIEPINYEILLKKHNIIPTENDFKFNYLKKLLINIGSIAGLTDEELKKLKEIQLKAKL